MCESYQTIFAQICLGMLLMFGLINFSVAAKTYQLPSGEILHDPTKPNGWGASYTSKNRAINTHFTLNYIRLSAGNKKAMINGQKVEEGDHVSGATVLKIKQNSVTLSLNGRYKVLKLNKILRMKKSKVKTGE